MDKVELRKGEGWPIGTAMLAAQEGKATQVLLDGKVIAVVVPPDMADYALRHGWGR